MNLKTYDTTSGPSIARPATININVGTGAMLFSAATCNKLGLTDGTLVKFHQDNDSPKDWYLEKVDYDGFRISEKKTHNHYKQMTLINSGLCREILQSIGVDHNISMLVVTEPLFVEKLTLYPILTASARQVHKGK